MTVAGAGPQDAGRAGSGRRRSVLAGLLLACAVLLVTAGPWVRSSTSSAVDADVPVLVQGSSAAPGVTAAGLVVLAASVALALVGRRGRWVAGGGLLLAGALTVAACVGVLADPRPAAESAAQESVGVGTLLVPPTVTPLPWVALVLGAAAVLLGLHVARVGGRWQQPTSRHESSGGPRPATTPSASPAPDEHTAWDALSRGEDPT